MTYEYTEETWLTRALERIRQNESVTLGFYCCAPHHLLGQSNACAIEHGPRDTFAHHHGVARVEPILRAGTSLVSSLSEYAVRDSSTRTAVRSTI